MTSASRWLRRKPSIPGGGRSDRDPDALEPIDRGLQLTQVGSAVAGDPYPPGGGAGDHGERSPARLPPWRTPRRPVRVRRRSGSWVVGPDDSGGVRLVEFVAETHRGATAGDRRAVDDQGDDLEALSVGAAGQLVALGLDLRSDLGDRGVDEAEDRTRADVEQLFDLPGVGGQRQRDLHPLAPGRVLAGAVGLQDRIAHAASHDVAGDAELLGSDVRADLAAGIADIGLGPVGDVRPARAADRRGEDRIVRDRLVDRARVSSDPSRRGPARRSRASAWRPGASAQPRARTVVPRPWLTSLLRALCTLHRSRPSNLGPVPVGMSHELDQHECPCPLHARPPLSSTSIC